ncbi:MAG: hypothetical protein HC836_35865 [Richelia sp. RM2_1_2]|nr:hypothetical protein [Richelia sp. RM2_1_2]
MNKSQRIRTTVGGNDKYLQVKLEQNTDFLEILSLQIDQNQAYQFFNSDYGVIVGRVLANNSIAVPNAKISVFIPITDADKERADIFALYPYENPRDKNNDGKRYNLLPRVSKQSTDGTFKPIQPFGSFPPKEEVVTNESYLEVYEKYYKFTTVTNNSGDYMIFGVPVGIQTVHLSVDITDIGKYSMTVGTMINQLGYSPNLFTDNETRIKEAVDLQDLPNIETQEIAVDVRPFWGDTENYEIGITRQDFRIRAVISAAFTVFGSAFTDAFRATWGQNDTESGDQDNEMWRMNDDAVSNVSVATKRIGTIVIDVYTIKSSISDADAEAGNFDTKNDIVKLDPTLYTSYIRNGDFVLTIPCNRDKVVTNEFGQDIAVDDTNADGIFTRFRGMFICRYGDELSLPGYDDIAGGKFDNHTFGGQRWRMKIPQNNPLNQTLNNGSNETYNENWRKEHHFFSASTIYSISKFHALNFRNNSTGPIVNTLPLDPFNNVGVIVTDAVFDADNPSYQFPSNGGTDLGYAAFGAEWINFTLHFPQHTYFIRNQSADRHSNDSPTFNPTTRFFYLDNTQKLLGSDTNTINMLRGDFHKTKFIVVPREDIVNIANNAFDLKGFRSNQAPFISDPLIGTDYQGTGIVKYFYRGIGLSDCIAFLLENGIIST